MGIAGLDFRFGWRWLLPVAGGERIRLYGFSNDEELFWRGAFPTLDWSADGGRAEVLVVDAAHCTAQAMPSLRGAIPAALIVCMLLSRSQVMHWRTILHESFPQVREYGLLPSGTPRVVVPLSLTRHATTALSLHRPGRWIARLGLRLARALACAGSFELLRGRVLLIATRSPDFIPEGAVRADVPKRIAHPIKDYALYLGTPDDNRKTVVLPLGDSPPDIILKVAAIPTARHSLNNEAAALLALSKSSLSAFVPRLHGTVSTDNAMSLYQEYRPRRQTGHRKMDAAVVAFLGQLTLLGHNLVPLSSLLVSLPVGSNASLPAEVEIACHALHRRLRQLGESGAVVWVHRTHGDFAPWNCTWTDQGLFIFDWEESQEQDLALGDAFYFAIAPALLVHRKASRKKTLEAALSLANSVVEASGARLDSRIYLALWLLRQVGQADLYGELIVLLERSWR